MPSGYPSAPPPPPSRREPSTAGSVHSRIRPQQDPSTAGSVHNGIRPQRYPSTAGSVHEAGGAPHRPPGRIEDGALKWSEDPLLPQGRQHPRRGPASIRSRRTSRAARPGRLPPRAAAEKAAAPFCGKIGGSYRFRHPEVDRRGAEAAGRDRL